MKKISLFSIFIVTLINADFLEHTISNQGFTGLINTPNASVANEGDMTFHFDNQFDNVAREYNYNGINEGQQDYIFGIGMFKYFEFQGRLSESKRHHRDLSANFKFELPYKHKYLPNFAIGFQDVGSAADNYGNQYIVMDKQLYFLRVSLGYGNSNGITTGKKRMDGIFGGLELKTFDWLYLLAEDDTKERFAGVRVHMPKTWSTKFKLNTLLSTNLTDNYSTSFSINLTFPLYENINSYSSKTTNLYKQNIIEEASLKSLKKENKQILIPPVSIQKDKTISIDKIKTKLADLGLENITIATKKSSIYLAYENGVFLHNDLDAMGVTIGLLSKTKYKHFILEQKRSKVVVMTIQGDLEKAKIFYANPDLFNKELFTSTLHKTTPIDLSSYKILVTQVNDSFLKPKVEFSPVAALFVGNEFGLFNYMLWLQTKAVINIYKGIDISALGYIHIYDSEIDDHSYDWFMRLYKQDSFFSSAMIHKSDNIFSGVNTLSFGTFNKNFIGAIDQYIYNYGNHTINFKVGYFGQFQEGDPYREAMLGKIGRREIYLAKYSYLLEDYDFVTELNVGKYWNQDLGFDLTFKRYFGDIAVSLSYEQSKPFFQDATLSEKTDRYAGIGIEIPLTFKHTPLYKYGQIKGTREFSQTIRSTILREDGSNRLVPGGNYNPEIAIDSEKYFYNRNRLQLSYIKTHAFRLVEAYENY